MSRLFVGAMFVPLPPDKNIWFYIQIEIWIAFYIPTENSIPKLLLWMCLYQLTSSPLQSANACEKLCPEICWRNLQKSPPMALLGRLMVCYNVLLPPRPGTRPMCFSSMKTRFVISSNVLWAYQNNEGCMYINMEPPPKRRESADNNLWFLAFAGF